MGLYKMPELPEVEVTRLGLLPLTHHQLITHCTIRQPKLRWPIPEALAKLCQNQTVHHIARRGKYLLLQLKGSERQILIHLGMSGHLRVLPQWQPPQTHAHIDLQFQNGSLLRYKDPRRFGCWLIAQPPVEQHPLLQHLGPEPLSYNFNADYLYQVTRTRRIAIKNLIMQQSIVVGIGNIYASEALFHARIRPDRASYSLSYSECQSLIGAAQTTLQQAIAVGGTSLKDFYSADGQPGYFSLSLAVYNRHQQPCPECQHTLTQTRINQRQSVYCPHCQA